MLGDVQGCLGILGNARGCPEGMPGRDARKGAVLTIDYEGEVTPGGSTLSALLASR